MRHRLDATVIVIGICLWAIALVILLIAGSPERWWVWTAAAGIGGGLLGLLYLRRQA